RERPRHFSHHASRFGRRQRTTRANALAERLAFDVAHHEEDETVRFADAVDRNDMRVREAGGHSRFTNEALACMRLHGGMGGKNLEGDVAVELDVAREIDDAHAATAELALKRVLTGQGRLEVEKFGRWIGHYSDTTGTTRGFVCATPPPAPN